MVTLTALPWWVLLPATLVVVFGVTFGLRSLLVRFFGEHSESAVGISAPLMTAFGALFAFISAFVIAAEWSTISAADAAVAAESRAAARLAWASTADGVDTEAVQAALDGYLARTVDVEWDAMAEGRTIATNTVPEWQRLERTVRIDVGAPGVASTSAGEMLGALDDLADARRERLDLASRSLPLPLFGILGLSGLALCVNAAVLALPHAPRATLVAGTIVAVVALDLGLVLVLGGPFRGSSVASSADLVAIRDAVAAGYFTL